MSDIQREMLAALVMVAAAAAVAGPPPTAALPEDLVRRLRAARIAGMKGQVDDQKALLESGQRDFPDAPAIKMAWLEFHRTHASSPGDVERIKEQLRPQLLAGDRDIPLGVLKLLFQEREAAPADLELLRTHLAARLARFGDDPALLRLAAQLELRCHRPAAAREVFGRLLALKPDPALRRQCIDLDLELGKWDDALALIRAERRDGDDISLRMRAIKALIGAGRRDALEAELATFEGDAAGGRGVPVAPIVESGFHLLDEGREAEAEGLLRRLHRLVPGNQVVERIVVSLFGSPEEQATFASRERLAADVSPRELVTQGSVRLAAGDAEGAFDLLSRATERSPQSDVAWYNLSLAARKLKRWDAMERASDRALVLRPDWIDARIVRAEARLQQDRFMAALDDLYAVERLKPGIKDVWGMMVACHRGMGNSLAAEKAYERYRQLK